MFFLLLLFLKYLCRNNKDICILIIVLEIFCARFLLSRYNICVSCTKNCR